MNTWSESNLPSAAHAPTAGWRRHCGWRPGACLVLTALLTGCAANPGPDAPTQEDLVAHARRSGVLQEDSQFVGSPYEDVAQTGLFPLRHPTECQVAIIAGGEDSFALRLQALKNAKQSVRIQALVFKGDESGLRIAEILKQKHAEGVDVRVIVDAFSNPWLQSQWMLFDLKQHGIEVEGYEAMALQWLNEVVVPNLTPYSESSSVNHRYHEKLWIVDGETDNGMAVTGGLNIGNEYFRVNPQDPNANWRDQDVAVRGKVMADMVTAFDRNFEHFLAIKESRGILNTNLYWEGTRTVLDTTGRVPIRFSTDPELVESVVALEARQPATDFLPARCRFLQQRPRLKETYIQQAYLKLIQGAEEELLIANAYFIPTPSMTAALEYAAKRCVAVTLLSNSPETNDLPEISMVGRGYYKSLLAINDEPEVQACRNPHAGIRIQEWVGQSMEESGPSQGTMHSKYAVVDGKRSLVGSYNLDPRSEKLNSESAIVFEQVQLSEALRALFLDHDLKYSREIIPADAEQFAAPEEVIYRFRKELGHLFESAL